MDSLAAQQIWPEAAAHTVDKVCKMQQITKNKVNLWAVAAQFSESIFSWCLHFNGLLASESLSPYTLECSLLPQTLVITLYLVLFR